MDDVMINPGRTTDRAEDEASESSAPGTPLFDESGDSEYRTTFQYMPLESSSNSIRLVVLEPHGGDRDSEIACRITHTTFGAKPVYKALSYTWGDETKMRNIKLNGCLFAVSNNLYEALSHLRTSAAERTLWIDAISINQTDIDEKSSQIKLMPFIYKRAQTVVVWLGANFDAPIESSYWQRVWVIQEFGKARNLEICWAPVDSWGNILRDTTERSLFHTWEGFLDHHIRTDTEFLHSAHSSYQNIRKFKKLRETRYGDSSLLRNLLKDHKSAQCKDPRDKVYGLVGLSIDCSGRLPIDYRKTLWEVYEDVIIAYDGYSDILGLSKLLKSLIGGSDKVSPRDLENASIAGFYDDFQGFMSLNPSDPRTVKIPSRFLGRIVYLGPTYSDAMSNPQEVSEWEQAVEQWVSHDQPEYKREQSDLFLESLEEINEGFLTGRLSLTQKISWLLENGASKRFRDDSQIENDDVPKYENRQAPSLFLVQDENHTSPLTPMGIACESAELEDLIFQVPNHDLAFVVRDWGYIMKLIGFAGIAMTAEQWKDRKARQRLGENGGTIFYIPGSNMVPELNVCLDMATLYKMSD